MINKEATLLTVTMPYACYGILVKNDTVVEAPPIARWMIGRRMSWVSQWVNKKGGTVC